jgi:peptide/nickel transport system substrate-binding protein
MHGHASKGGVRRSAESAEAGEPGRRLLRFLGLGCLLAVACFGVTACGGSDDSGNDKRSKVQTITMLMGFAPDYLDPGLTVSAKGTRATWSANLGLLTLSREGGVAGTKVIPALAKALPTISDDGLTYTLELRPGMKYSNGKPVKASDFKYTIERALALKYGGATFYTSSIAGAQEYADGKSKSISGIKVDDSTGKIELRLTAPNGSMEGILAVTGSGLVPSGTPIKNLTANPPPGVGPYVITDVVPNKSFTMAVSEEYTANPIPGVPPAHVNIDVKIQANNAVETQQVLRNQADVMDDGDQVAPSLFSQVESQAKDRFELVPMNYTYYFFLNTTRKPFNNELARQAVDWAIDRKALARLANDTILPGCYMLPPGLIGHSDAPCPHDGPDIARAKQLVQQSGMAGTRVEVWGPSSGSDPKWVSYLASVLNEIGFEATEKIVNAAQYFATTGSAKVNPQAGTQFWGSSYPHPSDFYLQLDARSITAEANINSSKVDDPRIQKAINELSPVPISKLDTAADRWKAIDEYATKKAYYINYGYGKAAVFTSDRIAYDKIKFNPVYHIDWASLQLDDE